MNPSFLRAFALVARGNGLGRRVGARHPAARRRHRRRRLRGRLSRRPRLQRRAQHHRHHGPRSRRLQRAEGRAPAGLDAGDLAGQRLLARRLGPVRPARRRARRVRRPRHADLEARHALVQGAAELRRRQRRLGRGARGRDRQAGLSGGAARRPRARRGRGRRARCLGALRGQGAERHRRLHDAGGALRCAPDRRLDAGRRPGRDPRDEDGGRRDADARRRRRPRAAAAPAGRAQARRLPPHADRPEEGAGRGRDGAADPRVRRSRRSNRASRGWTCRCAPPPRARATQPPRRIATEAPFAPAAAARPALDNAAMSIQTDDFAPMPPGGSLAGRRRPSGLARRGGDRAGAPAQGPGRVRRPGQGARAARDLHRRGADARRGDGPRAAVRPARPRQDDAQPHHRQRARRQPALDLGAGAREAQGPGGDPHQPREERRALHRRDPPALAGGRGDPLSGARGLPDRHHDRRRPGGALDQARAASPSP